MSLPLSISMPVKASTPSSTSKDDLLEKVEIKKPAGVTRTAAGKVWEDPILADWNPSKFFHGCQYMFNLYQRIDDFRLFVGNLGKEVTDAMLKEAFSPFPSLTNHRVVRDRRSSRPKGYGFVAFSDPDEYVRAMREMNGKYIGSKPVKLTKSSWKDRNIDEHKFRPY